MTPRPIMIVLRAGAALDPGAGRLGPPAHPANTASPTPAASTRVHPSIGSSAASSYRPVTMLVTRRTLPCQGAAASREPGAALALRLQGQLTRDALVPRLDGDLHRREQRAPGLHPPDDDGRLCRPVLG